MKISNLTIERYVSDVSSAAETAQVEGSPEALARAEVMRRDNAAILRELPPAEFAARVQTRAQRRKNHLHWYVMAATLACAAIIVAVVPRNGNDEDTTRAKGIKPQLAIFRQRAGGAEKLSDGAVARAGDTLQLTYIAGGMPYGAVVSVDGRGTTTVHPMSHGGELSQRAEVLLPSAYTLDDAPRFERFVLVASQTPVDSARLADVLHTSPDIAVPQLREVFPRSEVVVLTITKAAE